jgi:hypothetical protein
LAKLFQSGGGGGGGIESFSVQSIAALGEISSLASGQQYRPVVGDGGATSASNTPFGTSGTWETGTLIFLRGTDATNTVTINHNDAQYGAILNGTMVLGLNDLLKLIYDATSERWVEVGRNN